MMNAAKRPRPAGLTNIEIVDLTIDDEEPSPKRHQSITPVSGATDHELTTAPITNGNLTPKSSMQNVTHRHPSPTPKRSPWKGRPAWMKQSTGDGEVGKEVSRKKETRHEDLAVGRAASSKVPMRDLPFQVQHQPPYQRGVQKALVGDSSRSFGSAILPNFTIEVPKPLKFDPSRGPNHDVNSVELSDTSSDDSAALSKPRLEKVSSMPAPVSVSERKQPTPSHLSVHLPVRSPQPTRIGQQQGVATVTSPLSSSQAPKPKFVVNVPPTEVKRRRKDLIEKLKNDTEYAKDHSVEVQRVLGLTGFSPEYPTNIEKQKYLAGTQPSRRVVDRSLIRLDLGSSRTRQRIAGHLASDDFIHPRDQVKAVLTDRFAEEFSPPLTFSNDINDRRLHGKFQFISSYILRKGVKSTGAVSNHSCKCQMNCGISCRCLHKSFDDVHGKSEEQVQSYYRRPDGLVVLGDQYIDKYAERAEISECNELCSCDESCTNRVVQKGRTIPLEVFETRRCGFGVRSAAKIFRGQFIELYLGEVITEAELLRREAAKDEEASSYIFSLDWFSAPQCYHIDGEHFGSAMRFVNHSCNPNARTFTVLNHQLSRQLHYVAFFAVKDIEPGTEITIDYSPQQENTNQDIKTVQEDDGVVKCLCGESTCRGLLWRPGRERKSRRKLRHRDD